MASTLGDDELLAPSLMWSEARSALHELLWRREVTPDDAVAARARVESGPITRRAHRKLGETAWQIADQFGQHGVSIKSMQQRGIGADARLIFATHRAREADLRATVHALRDVDVVHRVGSVVRVLGDEEE